MDNELKWIIVLFALFIGAPMAGMALSDYHHAQCRLEGIKAQMPSEEILKLCGK